jgi:hypothetical protein
MRVVGDPCHAGTGGAPLTLAASLTALRPGDPCPCCGAGLGAASPAAMFRGPGARGTTGRDGGALVCSECGCEVEPVDDVPHRVRPVYCTAA